jgi:hypothetical protein
VHGPWDSQNVVILLSHDIVWPNDSLTVSVYLLGNFSNTLCMWVTIANQTGAPIWQWNWQPNATELQQSNSTTISIPPDIALGYYTIQVVWDHHMVTCDFWIVQPDPLWFSDIDP